MKAKGAPWDEHGVTCTQGGPGCYAAGDGGIINVRLVSINADGTPNLSNVLAQETVDPRTRYFATKSAYGVSGITLFWYFNMGGVSLKANTPYVMVYRNLHGDPAHNFVSNNSIQVRDSDAGPNGRNNLDPNAPGAIAGLDPREATTWSSNGGSSWTWGRQVGHYFGSATGDEGTRLPHYAWQSSPTAKPESNQPYTAYMTSCTPCTLNNAAVPRRTTLTEAGGYAPVGKSVGVVTVRNMRTGQTGKTASLGEGIRKGSLSTPVTVEVGDSYQITHTGTVFKMEADGYQVSILGLGSGAFPFTTVGHGADRAQLFALPHPYYANTTTPPPPPPPPADTTPPETTIVGSPPATTQATTQSFDFSASESGSSFQCKLDSGAFSTCSAPKAYSGLAVGGHSFEVRATDAAGNVDATPAIRSWTVAAVPPPPADTTPPETTIVGSPPATTQATTQSFDFSASESGSSFQCKLDSGAFSTCSAPKAYSGLAVGGHSFEVRATDAAGNVDATPAIRSWTVAAVPPPPPADETIVPATADKALGRPATASSVQNATLGAGQAVDGSSTSRWSSGFSDGQSLQVDLGSVRPVNKVSINWEAAYAPRYWVMTSEDGTTYSLAAEVTITKAGWKTTAFLQRQARYVKVEGVNRATVYGISFWDLRVGGPAESGTEKAAGRPTTASSTERSGLESAKAVDGSATSRWSSNFTNNQWWRVDLGSIRQVDRVSINWEAAYASRYKILTSTDGMAYTLAADVSITKAGVQTTTFASRNARYVKIEGVTRATVYGISFWDVQVFGFAD